MSLNRLIVMVALGAVVGLGCGGSTPDYHIPADSEFKPFIAPEAEDLVADSEYDEVDDYDSIDEEVEDEGESEVEEGDSEEDADTTGTGTSTPTPASKSATPAKATSPATPAKPAKTGAQSKPAKSSK